jgi:histone H3/H4
VKFLYEPDTSSSPEELYEELCTIAEEAARKYITSKVPSRGVSDLSIAVDLEESEGLNIEVDVSVTLSRLSKDVDEKKLAEEAVRVAFEAIDNYMREVKCLSRS